MTKQLQKIMSLILAVLLMLGTFPGMAMVASTTETSSANISYSYVDQDSDELMETESYVGDEIKTASDVDGYVYTGSYTQNTTYVYNLNCLSYLYGYPDGSVGADKNITRCEAAAIIYRLCEGEFPKTIRKMELTDVPESHWAYTEIATLYACGIISGYPDGTFKPNEPITRAEFVTMAVQFDGLEYVYNNSYVDVMADHWAIDSLAAAIEAGWLVGYLDGTYRPDSNITRAEVVTLTNRMLGRSITLVELRELDIDNPYNDIAKSHWAYCDIVEATVTHKTEDWHGLPYSEDEINVVVKHFVDEDGNKIAESDTTKAKDVSEPERFRRYTYLGFITTITYVYTEGVVMPSITKIASKSEAKVGDSIVYTITAANEKTATADWQNIIITDELPVDMDFTHGSVYVNGKSAEYSYKNGVLSVSIGNVAPGKSVKLTFSVTVASTAYGKTITNTALAVGDNGDASGKDGGLVVAQGVIEPTLIKTADVTNAVVGQTITYTLTVSNGKNATYPWENAVISDILPDGLSFVDGSVYVDGASHLYTFKNDTLSISMGDIAVGESYELTFKAKITEAAYGTTIYNVATGAGDNIDDIEAADGGASVADGEAIPSASKTASVQSANVGDTIIYTITASNSKSATAAWANTVISDALPDNVTFTYGSVQVGGVAAAYSYNASTRTLKIPLGDILPGESVTATFAVTIGEGAYGKTLKNTAVLSGDNTDDIVVSDDGVAFNDGIAYMSATKSVNKFSVKVGDTLTYTITATNSDAATVNLKNVVMSDMISEYLSFTHGSVQVDGYSAKYSYDNEAGQLAVELGDIAPGQTKIVTFAAVVNSSAYGKTFENTAVLSSDNDDDKTATDKGVTVDDGTTEGSVGAKTVSSSTAKVGDTLTYTITLRNASTATAAWTNVKVSDVIPEHLTFISGSVEENGRASMNYAYDAGNKMLTLYADSIAPGETVLFTFKVTVQDGAQGLYIVNTAVVESDGREDIQLPDTGVQIDSGNTAPYMTKSASVTEAYAGDIFTYTVTVKNGADATAAWKNVVLSDVLPTGVKLVAGSVTLNGQTVSYGIFGQAIEVTVGDLNAGQDAVVIFDVRVLDNTAGTSIANVATAKGDNGEKTATDNGVTVPNPDDVTNDPDENTVTGSKTVDKTLVSTGEKVTYTITAANNTEITWTGVQIYDVLDTSVLTLIDDTIYIDGIRYRSGSGRWTFADRQLVVNLGDIAAGKTVQCSFTVQFKNDAANSTFTNHATIKSTNNDSVYVKAPEVTIFERR